VRSAQRLTKFQGSRLQDGFQVDSTDDFGRDLASQSLAAGAALLGLAGAAAAEEAKLPPLAAAGERLYVRHCAVCHGRSASGDGPFRGVLTVPPTDLTGIAARRGGAFPRDEIAAFVDGRFVPPAHGTREMPVWGLRFERLYQTPEAPGAKTDAEARASAEMLITGLVDYIRTLQAE